MKEEIEEIVLEKIKSGDFRSCSYIVDKYKNYVYNIAFKVVQIREDAEEIAQDSFIKAFNSISDFKKQSKFSTWLYRITLNNAISKTRGKKIYMDELDDHIIDSDNFVAIGDGFENLSIRDRRVVLKQSMGQMSQEDQLLLTLYYFEDNSIAEVANITEITENLIKVKIHRARKKLFNLISDLMGIKMEDVL